MDRERVARLVQFCRDRVGQSLQSVVVYGRDDYRFAYFREDLGNLYSRNEFEGLIDSAWAVHEVVRDVDGASTPTGAYTATVHAFADSIVLQVPVRQDWGCMIGVDPAVGRNVTSFLEACRAQISDR